MRRVYPTLVILITAAVLLFSFQNLEAATVTLLSVSVSLPLSLLVIAAYLLGMTTGGFLLALPRGWIHEAGKKPGAAA